MSPNVVPLSKAGVAHTTRPGLHVLPRDASIEAMETSFEDLIAEADAAPIEGWDFSWLDGRATEERPTWHYSERVAKRAARAKRMLDLQSGGGELLAGLPELPPLLVATEGYMRNVSVAARRLRPLGVWVVATDDERQILPLADASFDLVTSRHPVETWWAEISRVLAREGTYLSQQVGPNSLQELSEFFLGPLPPVSRREPERAREAAEAVGLRVTELRSERLRTVFYDVGAVVYFLRLVVWIVPGFSVESFRERLLALHRSIERDGAFVSFATRFLIEAIKP